MLCPQCQVENRDTAKFCEECGSKLVRSCPGCGQEVSPRAKFCPECGTRLTASMLFPNPSRTEHQQAAPVDPTASLGLPPAQRRAPEAERRQLTVLFCDLVDSTALAGRLDPEEWREVVRAYQATCAEVIQRFDGHIAQYLGDGLLIYFGYPQAHEDDAQRAVWTGLGMVEAIRKLNAQLQQDTGIQLAVRVGIHTGLVVVGEMGGRGRQEQLALGDTPNIAARLQGLAAPNTVVLSATTRRLVEAYFMYAELGPQALKGVARPLAVSQVLGESGVQSRLDAAAPRGLTPLVGREQEVGLLLERWNQVKERLGQMVVLSGEAGIGKSRLVQAVKDRIAGELHVRWECRCSPYYQNSALYPIIDLFQRALQFQRDEPPEAQLGKLEEALARYHVPLPDVVPLFAALLSLPMPDRYPPLTLTPQRQRQKTLEAVLVMVLAVAAQQPVLLIMEDLHWIDPSTLEVLTLLLDQTPTARILTVLTCRPEFHPPWAMRAHLTHLTLSRLPRTQAEVMVERVTGGKALPVELAQQVVAKTDGVPLFVEELTKMVLESGLVREREDHYELTGPLPPLAIPATLHDSLMARLDRLATVRGVAQLGATLGREFAYELLEAVSPLDPTTLQRALTRLVEAELLYQRGVPPQATYLFKHALIQEAAYQSLLKSTRQQSHQRSAQVLAEQFPETAETQPELLAHHYTEAALPAQAIPYWQRAGQRARERSAHLEAIAHLTKGLELLKILPDTPERLQHELGLQITLGLALGDTKGYAAPEAERAYTRARELCQQVGETPQLFAVLRGLGDFYRLRGELQTARELEEQCLSLAQRQQDPVRLLRAHNALAMTLLWLGEVTSARAHLEQGMTRDDLQQHRSRSFGLPHGALVLWLLGYPDQALARINDALTLGQELAHPHDLAFYLCYAAQLHQLRREGPLTLERAEAAITLSSEQGFALYVARGTPLRGWALAEQGEGEAGMAQIHRGLAAWRATGAEVQQPYWLALLAEAYGTLGQPEAGLTALAEALTLADKTGERWYEPELYRLKGALLLQQCADHHVEAHACFHQALDVARSQQAKSLELRSATSLSRLWQQQGKHADARQLLGNIYHWFTEGFDTADLQEARALLEALS